MYFYYRELMLFPYAELKSHYRKKGAGSLILNKIYTIFLNIKNIVLFYPFLVMQGV